MSVVSMKALLETGVHFGHRTRRWNPKMKPYIFTERNGIHILDLQQTIGMINDAYDFVRQIASEGGVVLFVGTKRQAQDTIAREAVRCRMPYINQRWLGGTLTNWTTIRQRINHLDTLERRRDAGEFEGLKKKERLMLEREVNKLNLRLGGIRTMTRLPDALFVVDVNHEETAIKEANKLGIPVIGMVDTNSDPDVIDQIIPSNDDAIRAIKLICSKVADGILEGHAAHEESLGDEEVVDMGRYDDFDGMDDDAQDEDLLGEATLAKIRRAEDNISEETEEKLAKAAEAPVVAEEAPEEVPEKAEATEEA